MNIFVTRQSAARLIFIIGFFFMFLGNAFLFGSLVGISRTSILISFSLVILGIGCAILAIKLHRRSSYLFFAALFLQAGLFLFLYSMHIIPVKLAQSWPLLSVFTGLALIPAGWHRYGAFKTKYIVPSFAFILLGSALMVFSLDLVGFSLTHFVRNWWPLLTVLAGITLILVSLSTKYSGTNKS
jgi:hypothetical protein